MTLQESLPKQWCQTVAWETKRCSQFFVILAIAEIALISDGVYRERLLLYPTNRTVNEVAVCSLSSICWFLNSLLMVVVRILAIRKLLKLHFQQQRVRMPGERMWQKTFIIVTGGRTGSTTLAAVLNCGIRPGCLVNQHGNLETNQQVFISGENNHVLWGMWKTWNKYKLVKDTPSCPWYGLANPQNIPVKDVLQQGNPSRRILGYKEIRWFVPNGTEVGAMGKYLSFLSSVTPGLKLIFLFRDPVAMQKSVKNFYKPGIAAQRIEFLEELLKYTKQSSTRMWTRETCALCLSGLVKISTILWCKMC